MSEKVVIESLPDVDVAALSTAELGERLKATMANVIALSDFLTQLHDRAQHLGDRLYAASVLARSDEGGRMPAPVMQHLRDLSRAAWSEYYLVGAEHSTAVRQQNEVGHEVTRRCLELLERHEREARR